MYPPYFIEGFLSTLPGLIHHISLSKCGVSSCTFHYEQQLEMVGTEAKMKAIGMRETAPARLTSPEGGVEEYHRVPGGNN